MSDLAIIAASSWAHAHAPANADPVEFGNKVALVYCACQKTEYHAGDEKAIAAALAALSIPSEVLKLLAQLSSLPLRSTAAHAIQRQTGGAE